MKHALTLLGLMACLSAGAQSPASFPSQMDASALRATPSGAVKAAVPAVAGAAAPVAQQFTLRNGMTLIVQPDHRAPTAMQMVWVRVGAVDEHDGTTGVAHALEHMMFKGTKKLAPGEFSRRVAALGGQENAFTNRDYTGYYQQIPANKLEEVMKLESDRFANNQWPDAEFTKEIAVVKEERRMRTDDQPRAMLYEQLFATALIASPYRRPVVGWMSDLDTMTANDVREFHQKWYVPANAALVVAGDVDVNQVRAWAQKYYGSIPARPVPVRKQSTEPKQLGERRVDVKAPAEQAVVSMIFRVPSLQNLQTLAPDDRDALSLLMLSAVLSGYDGARLERALTQGEASVADSASSGAMVIGGGPGMFMLSGVPANGKTTAQVEAGLRAEVERIAKEGVAVPELERVKTQWQASTVYERDSLNGQANDLGSNWIQGLPLNANDLLLAQLRTITPADVQSVAARYFGSDQLTVGTLVPQPMSDEARAAQKNAAPAGGAVH